jgi:phosphatidylinositol-3-phosphatase
MFFNFSINKIFTLVVLAVASGGAAFAAAPSSSHVVLVVEENHSYESVIGNRSMPVFNKLASGYGLATRYFANSHNSIPNYFWLTAGQPVTFADNTLSFFSANNIVQDMQVAGKSWKSYAEGLPYAGYTGYNHGLYVKRHNPLAYFTNVAFSSEKFNLVPFSQFAEDVRNGNLPNFSFVEPNLLHDAHNGSLAMADRWLQTNIIAPLFATPPFQPGGDGILIITFDESSRNDCRPGSCRTSNSGGGRVATIIVGPKVKRGFKSAVFYRHQNVLRTIGVALGLRGVPGLAASAAPMSDFF